MKATLPARVFPEHAPEFQAEVANLSTSSLFLATPERLTFRQSLTVRFEDIAIDGVVAFVSGDPAGVVLAFHPSEEALRAIEEVMDDVVIVEGAGDPVVPLTWDGDETGTFGDPDDPTNTEGEPIRVEDSEDALAPVHVEEHHYGKPTPDPEAEVREAFLRSGRFPQRSDTEVTPNEALALAKQRAAEGAADDVESTISPATSTLADPAGTPVPSSSSLFRARTVIGVEPSEPKTDPSLKALVDPAGLESATVDVVPTTDLASGIDPADPADGEAPTHDEPLAADG